MELMDLQVYEYVDILLKGSEEWFSTEIVNIDQKFLIITLPKNLRDFFISDEVKCRVTDGKNTYMFYGEITDVIFRHPQSLVLFVPGQIKKYDKYRKEKRYSVNMPCQIYRLRRFFGFVTDLSIKGINIRTKGYLDKGDEIGISIYLQNSSEHIFFECIVVRKTDYTEYREYAIEIEYLESEQMDKYIKLIEDLEINHRETKVIIQNGVVDL